MVVKAKKKTTAKGPKLIPELLRIYESPIYTYLQEIIKQSVDIIQIPEENWFLSNIMCKQIRLLFSVLGLIYKEYEKDIKRSLNLENLLRRLANPPILKPTSESKNDLFDSAFLFSLKKIQSTGVLLLDGLSYKFIALNSEIISIFLHVIYENIISLNDIATAAISSKLTSFKSADDFHTQLQNPIKNIVRYWSVYLVLYRKEIFAIYLTHFSTLRIAQQYSFLILEHSCNVSLSKTELIDHYKIIPITSVELEALIDSECAVLSNIEQTDCLASPRSRLQAAQHVASLADDDLIYFSNQLLSGKLISNAKIFTRTVKVLYCLLLPHETSVSALIDTDVLSLCSRLYLFRLEAIATLPKIGINEIKDILDNRFSALTELAEDYKYMRFHETTNGTKVSMVDRDFHELNILSSMENGLESIINKHKLCFDFELNQLEVEPEENTDNKILSRIKLDHLPRAVLDHVDKTPNWLLEESVHVLRSSLRLAREIALLSFTGVDGELGNQKELISSLRSFGFHSMRIRPILNWVRTNLPK